MADDRNAIFSASDDDFMAKMASGASFEEPSTTETTTTETPVTTTTTEPDPGVSTTTATQESAAALPSDTTAVVSETPGATETPKTETVATTTEVKPETPKPATTTVTQTDDKGTAKTETTQTPAATTTPATTTEAAPAVDFKALYESLMAPLTANGGTIDIRSPEEVRQLMQMGANYTKKMQGLAPHRKVLSMLESNGLLDESQLSFAIDLMKKNPAAINKLIKDAGINPVDIDIDQPSNYVAGNHRVSENEADFRAALTDMKSTDAGLKTLKEIDSTWDHASKDYLLQEPALLNSIQQQYENGAYTKITTEVNRQRTLGVIAANVPFLQAYKAVGDQMLKSLQASSSAPVVQKVAPTLVGTSVEAPKPVVANSAAAAAASTTRATPGAVAKTFNPLAMSDEDFLKLPQLQNR